MPELIRDFLNWCLGVAMLCVDYYMDWRNNYGKKK